MTAPRVDVAAGRALLTAARTMKDLDRLGELTQWLYNNAAALLDEIEALRAENARLREALYPLVVIAMAADAHEDAPEYVNGEVDAGVRALPKCCNCNGTGATNGVVYEDVAIPAEFVCVLCGGWGLLKHPGEAYFHAGNRGGKTVSLFPKEASRASD